jgi:large subunit ribosomal protein L25
VREKQYDVIRGSLLHVDFQLLSLTEKVRADVGIHLIGEAPAVSLYNGIVVSGLDSINVECFPQDLPERIDVDITGLKNIGDGVYVRDLLLPDTIEVHTEKDELIVVITAPEVEEEVVEVEEVAEEEPQVIGRGKREEEE